jgi:capsid protein
MLEHQLCIPVWERFCEAAAIVDHPAFPSVSELLESGMQSIPAQHQAMGWEWVDPLKEQKASEAAVAANQSTLADELGYRGKDWKRVLRQRAREQAFMNEVGLAAEAEVMELVDGKV